MSDERKPVPVDGFERIRAIGREIAVLTEEAKTLR